VSLCLCVSVCLCVCVWTGLIHNSCVVEPGERKRETGTQTLRHTNAQADRHIDTQTHRHTNSNADMSDNVVNHNIRQGFLVVLRNCAGPWRSHPATSWGLIWSGLPKRPNVSLHCIQHLQKSVCDLINAGGICCEKCTRLFICLKILRWTVSTLVIFPAGLMKRLCIMLFPWLQGRILGPPSTTS
jgi:hypothetical protein